MVWAIDLDDSSLTKALGENIERPELPTYAPRPYFECGNIPDEL